MPHPKVLGFRALYFAVAYGIFFSYFSFLIFKMSFLIFGRCPKNCSIARKKYFARLWGAAAPQPLSSYAYVNECCVDVTRR